MEQDIMHNDGKNTIIVGEGPAGLTTAIELLRKSAIRPIILEETDRIGGISAKVCHNGDHVDVWGIVFSPTTKLFCVGGRLFCRCRENLPAMIGICKALLNCTNEKV